MDRWNRVLNPKSYEEQFLRLTEVLHQKNQEISADKLTAFLQNRKELIDRYHALIAGNVQEEEARLVQPVLAEFGELSYKVQELINGMKDKFLLFVVGMGNVGKSTLINSLLEQDAAVMDVLPKTWKIDVFEHRNDQECEIVVKTGETKRLSIKDTHNLIELEEKKVEESRREVRAEIRKNAPKPKTMEERDELKKLENKLTYKSDVIEVRWPITVNRLSGKFKLVDTPGLVQENLSGETKYSLQEYYHKADGVIWILDATRLAAASQHELMAELTEALDVIGGSTENIICVINRIDFIYQRGGDDAVLKVINEANRLFGQYFHNFIAVSAKEAYSGFKNQDMTLREASRIEELYQEIDKRFFQSAQSMKLKSKESSLKQVMSTIGAEEHVIKDYYNRLLKDQNQYQEHVKFIKESLTVKRDQFLSELNGFKKTFTSQVSGRVESLTSNLFDLQSESQKRDYMLNSIFRVQEVEDQINYLLRYWGDVVKNTTKEIHPEVLFKEYEFVDEEIVNAIIQGSKQLQLPMNQQVVDFKQLRRENNLPVLTDTSGMESFFQGALGYAVGGFLSGIGKGIVKLFTMGNVKTKLRGHFSSYIESNVNQASQLMQKQVDASIAYLENEMHDSYKVLHGDYSRSLLIKNLLLEFVDLAKEPYQKPDLYEIIKSEKDKLPRISPNKEKFGKLVEV